MTARRRGFLRQYALIAAFAVAYLLVGFTVRNSYYQLMMTLVLVWAAMGLSWNMLSGYSGMISFGHAVFFGLGAYTVTIAFVDFGISPWIGIPIGIVVGVIAGVVIGVPTFRLRGHYFALSMLAYPLAILYVFEWLGYQEVSLPMKRESPALYAQFSDPRIYMMIALALVVICMLISLHVERSRFGMSLLAIKQNEPAAEAAGINAWRWKMSAMMLSAGMGAAAGGLYAIILLVITPPTVFGALVSAQALIVTLFGGVGVFWGPVIGASILVPLAETLHAELGHIIPGIQGVVYGLAIIAVILLAPDGIYWRVRDKLLAQRTAAAPALAFAPATPEPVAAFAAIDIVTGRPRMPSTRTLMQLSGVSRAFGGLRAVDDVSLMVREGSIHGIIGPNGAGKTTLFNVVNGFLAADGGSIRFDGKELVGMKPHQVCAQGIGRTFQVVRAFPRMTVLQNVIVGAFIGAADEAESERLAIAALHRVGLADEQAYAIAGGLTTKQLRLMELARALAPRPRMLLLDETLAGLGSQELEDVLRIIRQVNSEGVTIVIIEHTMHAMVKLVEHFSVLDHGKLIAEGPPSDVVKSSAVIEAYLGKKWMERAKDRSLNVAYGGLQALSEISLDVEQGEFVAVVGPNGAGKTTLFKTISGTVKPVSGEINYKGRNLLEVPASERAQLGIAHVPEGRQVFSSMTVMENLEMGAYTRNGTARWSESLPTILKLFPVLAERRDQLAGTLSGGEQQMLAIGRGLASAPELLMLDEPSMGLAPTVVDAIFDRIHLVHRQHGLTILLVEQRVAEALESCSRGYVLETGRVSLHGSHDTLMADPRVRKAYLGM